MGEYKVSSATSTDMTDNVGETTVDTKQTDAASGMTETSYQNQKFGQYLGYYKTVPEVRAATDTISRWVIGDGYSADPGTTVIFDHIVGNGLDTFDDFLENMDKMSRINGDSFAEIIRDPDTNVIINLKPLDPGAMRIVVDKAGMIKRYEQTSKTDKGVIKFKPEEIFHLCNGRIADEIHGVSDYESVERIIQALNESFEDTKTLVHRNVWPLRVIEADTDDPAACAAIGAKYEALIKNKEVLVVPKGAITIETQGLSNNATFNPLPWRETLKNLFYQLTGLPQILMGSASEFSESSAKIAYLSFEQTVKQRQRYIITQVWQQLNHRIDIAFPTTLQNEMLSDTNKDGANQQMNFQPSDVTAGKGK